MKTLRFILASIITLVMAFSPGSASAATVQDGSYRIVGHIKSDGTIQDGSYRTVGHVKSDGTIQDGSYRIVGYIKSDGTVQDSSYRTIGHARDIPQKWVAVFFFFNNFK